MAFKVLNPGWVQGKKYATKEKSLGRMRRLGRLQYSRTGTHKLEFNRIYPTWEPVPENLC